MKEIKKTERTQLLVEQLLDVWERCVRETHTFLPADDIAKIQPYVPQALQSVAHLVIEVDEKEHPVAFLGVEDHHLEMLFLAPEVRGKGLGKRLVAFAIERYGIRTVTVNEENPQARGFYEHMGFVVVGRSDIDKQGNPYPILRMELQDLGESE